MDKELDKLARIIEDVVDKAEGDTWQEKAAWLKGELESRNCEQLEEFTSWLTYALDMH